MLRLGQRSLQTRNRFSIGLLFTLPSIVFVLLMIVYPIFYTFTLSFHEWSGSARRDPEYVGTSNYDTLLNNDPRFEDAVMRTFEFTFKAVAIELILGLAIALLINGEFLGRGLVRVLILLPMVATPVAISMAWLLMFEPTVGLFNEVLTSIGFAPRLWLGSQDEALGSLILVDIWQWTPMMVLLLLTGLTTLPEEPFEAARVDGANAGQRFFYLTLPLLFPTMVTAVLLRTIDALKTFDTIYTMTRGGPGYATETINIYGYVQSFEYFSLGKASSLLVIFFAIVLGISLVFTQIRKQWGIPYND
ncbi:MAG: sugar ABC transporter permease [Anaerolineae bacterium]|nr:sugar ABC transporter permease [Anaerolineae bacterium]